MIRKTLFLSILILYAINIKVGQAQPLPVQNCMKGCLSQTSSSNLGGCLSICQTNEHNIPSLGYTDVGYLAFVYGCLVGRDGYAFVYLENPIFRKIVTHLINECIQVTSQYSIAIQLSLQETVNRFYQWQYNVP